MRETLDRLQHIQDAIIKIMKYTKRGRRRFDKEEGIQNSIIYYLQIMSIHYLYLIGIHYLYLIKIHSLQLMSIHFPQT